MNEQNNKVNILTPLIFFNIFDFPLTAVEAWQWQYKEKMELHEIVTTLNRMVDSGVLESKQGFYFLPGKEENVIKRLNNYNIAEKKYKKVRKICRSLALMPFVRMIAVCNTLAYSNANKNSDIDLFIITAKNKIWIARFFCIALLKLFGLQPDPKNMQDKFCLSFFVTEDAMNLKNYLLPEKDGWPDIYFLYWFITLYPVYDQKNFFEKLWQENDWIKQFFPHANPAQANMRRTIKLNKFWQIIKKIQEFKSKTLGNTLYKKIQLRILPKNLKEMANIDTRVIINDQVLKFHDNDTRENIRENVQCSMSNVQ